MQPSSTTSPTVGHDSTITIPDSPASRAPTRRRTKILTFLTRSQQHAKPLPLLISISIGLLVRFAVPKPSRVTAQAWQLLAFFLTTIAGLILGPLPVGAWAFTCLSLVIATDTLPFAAAFAAFTSEVIWLIVASFFFSRGFVKTGLGDRIAMYFVKWLGKSTIGLAYGLALSEAMIAPAMPSTTARAGGIFVPIINSLSMSAHSLPKHQSSNKLGAFLIHSQFQSSSSSSALFLTAAAQNLLCVKFAESLGVKIPVKWVTWFKAACVPAIVSLLVTPFVVYKIVPPETKHTPDAPVMATSRLEQMGPVTKNEWIMLGTMLLLVGLWIAGDALGVANVVSAMLGLSILLLLGVLDWDDCLSEKSAWDTLIWFGVLVGMANQLTKLGIIPWIADSVGNSLESMSLSWPAALVILQATYFFIHYLFASQTAHVGALYSAFLAMHLASKVPGLLAALALAFNTNLFGALTHYSSGQAAVYYGAALLLYGRRFFFHNESLVTILLDLWQIMGKAVAVKQTLLTVAWILQETKPRERILKCTSSVENCRAPKVSIDTPPKVVTFRLLCSHKAAGALIGWGGSKVKSLEKSTEASIKISKPVATHMERIVTVTAWECSEALFSPAQIAVTLAFSRSVEIDNEIEPGSSLGTGTTISAQLLVDSNQVSFLIDTKGMISSDIRTATGVEMQLSWGSSITSSDGKNDNILQISGLYESVLNALFLVTSRLRNLIFSTIVSDEAKKVQNCCSSYSNVNSYNRENTVSRGSEDLRALSPINHDMTLIQAMDRLGLLHNTVEGCIEASITDTTGGFASTKSGIKKGSVEFAVSANSREEIEVPEHILSCVYGESGSNLARIKQISGASIMVADPCAGKSCRKVIISGTVYSIQVARSLLQAFILPEF